MKRVGRCIVRALMIVAIVISVAALAVGVFFVFYVDTYVEKSIDGSLFYSVGSEAESRVFYYERAEGGERAGDAVELAGEKLFGGYRCRYASIDEIPQDMKDAFVAIEDKRFHTHSGVDWLRTVSAGVNYFLRFDKNYGGSTITQQLIKNVTGEDDFSFQRKIQEIFWALDLESKLSKDEILECYLNVINLSQGCYGVGAAAEYYFSKDVSELSLAECACIAAITNSPSYYDPIKNPENNKSRRLLILSEMYGQGYITKSEYESAADQEIALKVAGADGDERISSWYVDMVIEDVIDDLCEEYGYSRHMASLVVYTGGLEIYTAMDRDVQDVLDGYYSDASNFAPDTKAEVAESAMIIIDPRTGDILGVAGAVGEKKGNRVQNFATDTLRPAGSVIKPLSVYAPALEDGLITWASVYDDTPVRFIEGESEGDEETWTAWPQNSNGIYRGLTNVSYAVSHSLNTVPIKLLSEVGVERSFEFLRDSLRLDSLISKKTLADGSVITDMDYAALALGQFNYGVTVREMTAAYTPLSNDGVYSYARSYYKVVSRGDVILENGYRGDAVMSEENADIMTLMLSGVVSNGTASSITLDSYIDCAGKTGTTQYKYDNWFVGYTPYCIGGVWMGYEYPKSLAGYSTNKCIEIWDEVMTLVHQKYIGGGPLEFEISENIIESEYCRDSGELMTVACRSDARGDRAEVGYFVRGSEPDQLCGCHVMVDYDTVCGGVAVGECPAENIKQVGLVAVERSFPKQIYVTDAQYTWRDIGTDVPPETTPTLPFFARLLPENTFSGISRAETQFNRACGEHFSYFDWQEKAPDS